MRQWSVCAAALPTDAHTGRSTRGQNQEIAALPSQHHSAARLPGIKNASASITTNETERTVVFSHWRCGICGIRVFILDIPWPASAVFVQVVACVPPSYVKMLRIPSKSGAWNRLSTRRCKKHSPRINISVCTATRLPKCRRYFRGRGHCAFLVASMHEPAPNRMRAGGDSLLLSGG